MENVSCKYKITVWTIDSVPRFLTQVIEIEYLKIPKRVVAHLITYLNFTHKKRNEPPILFFTLIPFELLNIGNISNLSFQIYKSGPISTYRTFFHTLCSIQEQFQSYSYTNATFITCSWHQKTKPRILQFTNSRI